MEACAGDHDRINNHSIINISMAKLRIEQAPNPAVTAVPGDWILDAGQELWFILVDVTLATRGHHIWYGNKELSLYWPYAGIIESKKLQVPEKNVKEGVSLKLIANAFELHQSDLSVGKSVVATVEF